MAVPRFDSEATDMRVVGHLLAGGEMVPAQMPSPSDWSPEKKLAAAVLTGALVEVRDRHHESQYRRKIAEDLAWIFSDEIHWPYAFIPLCQLLGLEPAYVRDMVRRWMEAPTAPVPRQCSTHRHAA